MKDKGRAVIYIMAGIYLLYMACNIFGVRMDNGGSEYTLMLIFSILFVIFGVGLIGLGLYMMKKNEKK
ncbi:MAG: hypothetical protein ACI4DV_02545 [Lachnospiraceae bacterium]